MNMNEIKKLKKQYLEWLEQEITLKDVGEYIEISTPFLDRHNDYIQIYVRKDNGGYFITDDGYTIRDLEMSGCPIKGRKRNQILKMTLNGFGVAKKGNEICVSTGAKDFSLKKHSIIQAILAINDMFYLAEPTIRNLFNEDVENWLDSNEIRYSPNVSFTGKSGFIHHFDVLIPKSRLYPERIIQLLNNPRSDLAQRIIFAWDDTRVVRPSDSQAYVFINDRQKEIVLPIIQAFDNYSIIPVCWSKIEEVKEKLAA